MDNRPSEWMNELVEAVADCMEAHSAAGPIGWRYLEEDDHVTFVVYATPVELLGGDYDGTIVLPGFSLDVQTLQSLFEPVTSLNWKAQGMGPHDAEGPCLSIEGVYRGHLVWLRVLAEAPEDEEPGLEIDTSESG